MSLLSAFNKPKKALKPLISRVSGLYKWRSRVDELRTFFKTNDFDSEIINLERISVPIGENSITIETSFNL
jgi:hypothetical protein